MISEVLLSAVVVLSVLNLFFIISISNFIIKLANTILDFRKELEDYYFIQNKTNSKVSNNKEESGLVDL